MSYNQKVIGAITLVIALVTCAVAFVCFELPYDNRQWTALIAVVFAESLFGAFWIRQIARKDSVLPLALGGWGMNAGYLLFTLGCTLMTDMESSHYMLLQFVGFAVFVILRLLGGIAVHHVEEASKRDEPEQKIERVKVTWR